MCAYSKAMIQVLRLLLPLGLLFTSSIAHGSVFESKDEVVITDVQVIEDDLYTFANSVTINGAINGDVLAFAKDINIPGTVTNSINACGQNLNHNGVATGSIRFFGQTATINGLTEGSLVAMGSEVRLGENSVIGRDVTVAAGTVSLAGTVKGGAVIRAGRVRITGYIGGDINVHADKIRISPPAVILGRLTYSSKETDALVVDSGVTIASAPQRLTSEDEPVQESGLTGAIVLRISAVLAAFLFGLLAISLFRRYVEESVKQFEKRTAASLAAGFVGSLVMLITFVLLIFSGILTIAGLTLMDKSAIVGSLMLIVSILILPLGSFVGIAGAVIYYSAGIVASLVVGHLLLRKTRPDMGYVSKSGLLIGLVVLAGLFALPYFGTLVFLVVFFTGAGAIFLGIHYAREIPRTATPHSSTAPTNPS